MFSNAELKCIQSLLENKNKYLKYFVNSPEHEILSRLYASYTTAYNKFGVNILQATPIPTKPLDAYIAGGMANGIAGIGAGVAAFHDAKVREQKYEQSMLQYNSTLSGIAGACDEVGYYYGCIVNLIETNPKAAKKLNELETEIRTQIAAKEDAEFKFKFKTATVISLIAALFFGGIIGLGSGDLTAFMCVGGITFVITWICLMIKL